MFFFFLSLLYTCSLNVVHSGSANDFLYTSRGRSPVIDGVDDTKELSNTRNAFSLLGNVQFIQARLPMSTVLSSSFKNQGLPGRLKGTTQATRVKCVMLCFHCRYQRVLPDGFVPGFGCYSSPGKCGDKRQRCRQQHHPCKNYSCTRGALEWFF